MAKQKGGREVLNADDVVNVKQGDVAALLKKKALADEAAAKAAASAEPAMVAAADGVFASDAEYMVAQAGGGAAAGASSGLSTGALLGIGAAAIVGGVLIGNAISDDNETVASPSPTPTPGNTPTPTPGPGNSGNTGPNANTFTLTDQTDNLLGTSADETFIGDGTTTSAGDTLNGGGGTDTFKGFDTTVIPNITSIEKLYYNFSSNFGPFADVNVASKTDVTSIEFDRTGNAGFDTVTVGSGQKVILSNYEGGSTATVKGTATSVDVTVSKFGDETNGLSGIDVAGTSAATLNLAVAADSFVQVGNTGAALRTLNVTGSGALALDLGATVVKTVDASATTGGVELGVAPNPTAGTLTFKGGSGDDVVRMGTTLDETDVLTGGAGSDVLVFDSSGNTAGELLLPGLTKASDTLVSGFETVGFSDNDITLTAAATFDLARATGATGFISEVNLDLGGFGLNVQNFVSGGKLILQGDVTGTFGNLVDGLKVTSSATGFAGASDSINLTLGNDAAGTGSAVDNLIISNVETLNIASTGDANTLGLTDAGLKSIVITGTEDLTIQNSSPSITSIDGSAAKGDLDLSGVQISIAGATITGGSGDDVLFGSTGQDVIVGGAGDDIIAGFGGQDKLTGGTGDDTFVLASGDSTTTAIATITDFTVASKLSATTGFDKIDIGVAGVFQALDATGKENVADAATLTDAAQAALTGAIALNAAANATVFSYGGVTYFLGDVGATAGTYEADDVIVALTGVDATKFLANNVV